MAPESILLEDREAGTSAKVLAGYGFNCYSFQASHRGRPLELLWAAPDFETRAERASGSGIPLLFPFPGRIGGASFEFQGRTYRLEAGDGRGNAIHGFALNRPWQVVERSASRVVGRFQASVVDPQLLKLWPSDFTLTATYALEGNTLRSKFEVHNPGQGDLPCGLGTHPYFRLPVDRPEDAEHCIVTIPATKSWELVDMLPTGKRHSEAAQSLRAGMRFGDTKFDDVFTGLKFENGWATATIHDPASRRTIAVRWGDNFRECVVYNPAHREAFCIEPYTCVPDPFRLTAAGIDAGLRVLKPGESFTACVDMSLE